MPKHTALYILLIILFCEAQRIHAQHFPVSYQDLGSLEDYSNPQCLSLYQDCRGLLWINNWKGLDRWDGNSMVNFPYIPFDSTAFPARAGASITGDDQNNIWISYGKLAKFDLEQEEFRRIKLHCDNNELDIKYLEYDPTGFLWLICAKRIMQYYPETEILKEIPLHDVNGTVASNFEPRKILVDTTGRTWLADELHGLCYLDTQENVFHTHLLEFPEFVDKNMNLEDMKMDPAGIFWLFGAKAELASFNPYKGELQWAGLPLNSKFAPSTRGGMVIDKEGKIWFGVDMGLKLYDPVTKTLHSMDKPDDRVVILDMIVDKMGNILIASFEGVKIVDTRIANIRIVDLEDHILQDGINWISSISRYKELLWLGTYKSGLIRYNLETGQIKKFWSSGRPGYSNHHMVHKTLKDKNGRIWFTAFQSLYRVRPDQENFEYFDTGPSRIITRDEDGLFWILQPDYLVRFDPVSLDTIQITLKSPLPFQTMVTHLDMIPFVRDKEGILWYAQLNDGLYRIDPVEREWKHYTYDPGNPKGLPDQHIKDLFCDSRGTVWLSSWVGPSRIIKDPDNPQKISFDNHYITELQYTQAARIGEDRDGNIFVGTSTGVNVIRPDGKIDSYDHKDGLTKDPSIIWLVNRDYENGNMYLGSSKIAIIPPTFLTHENLIAPTLLTDFRLEGESVVPGENSPLKTSILVTDRIDLRHNQNFFRIDFATTSLSHPERNRYRYILEGVDKDTIYSGNQSYAEYTNLGPSKYTFWVSGSIYQDHWDPMGASIEIRIHPSWFRTQFAFGLYLVVLLALVLGYIRYRTYRFEKEKMRLEAAVKQRTEVIRLKNMKILEMDTQKTRFFNNISHQFRTLVTMVKAPVTSLMEEEKISLGGRRNLEVIYRNSNRLMQLVDQLLDISRIDKKNMKLGISERNIRNYAHRIAVSFASLAEVNGIRYHYRLPQSNGMECFDADKIEKVINNLLSNAFKYTEEGGRVSLQMELIKPDGGEESLLEIIVADTGHGIPEDEQLKVFDRFYQAESSMKNEGNGTGIGLALVHDLVKLMHGSIHLESKPGEGSVFTIQVPLGTEHLKKKEFTIYEASRRTSRDESPLILNFQRTDSQGNKAKEIDSKKPLLLVVEDNPDILWFIADKMKSNFMVLEAVDGSAGIKLAFKHMPDLIITDLMMPRLDGTDLCQILKTDLRTSHIPVIMLTARASMEDKVAGLKAGADDYISKPFEIKELKTRALNLVKQRRKLKDKYSREITLDPRDIVITSVDEKFLTRIMKVIERKMSNERLEVKDLCKEMNMSRSTLSRKLDALTGQSPVEFIRTLRLKRAAALMKERFGNISEIALEVGFSNPSYFSKMFKAMFSVSPTEFSRLQTGNYPGKIKSKYKNATTHRSEHR
jgi:signal transduction histidine kinase/DNA-binding response OmpR family regulator/ligand-binding sensor domain-containing protein